MDRPYMQIIATGIHKTSSCSDMQAFSKAVVAYVFSVDDNGDLDLTSFGSRVSTHDVVAIYEGLKRVVADMEKSEALKIAIRNGLGAEITQTAGDGDPFIDANR
jgi:hypothetical protein